MIRALLAVFVGFGFTVSPAIAAAPTAPDPSKLAGILPDPIDPTWVESPVEAAQYFDGPVTYENVRSYYTYYHQTESFIDAAIGVLKDNRFVAGYQRMWYRPNTNDTLTEEVEVFAAPAGAASANATFNANNAALSGASTTRFDPGLGSGAYGALETVSGFNFAIVDFTKGDASYLTGMASDRNLAADYITPQATLLWQHAPATVRLTTPVAAQLPFASRDWVYILAGLWLTVSLAVVAVVLVIVMFARRKNAAPAAARLPVAEPPPL